MVSFLLSITLTESSLISIFTNEKYLTISLPSGVFTLGQYVHFEKFAYTTRVNSPFSWPCFILNWGVRAAMFLSFLSLSNPPHILHAMHICARFATRGKSSSLLQWIILIDWLKGYINLSLVILWQEIWDLHSYLHI